MHKIRTQSSHIKLKYTYARQRVYPVLNPGHVRNFPLSPEYALPQNEALLTSTGY